MAVQFQSDMKLLTTQAGVAQKQMGSLTRVVLDLAGQVGFSPDSLSQALFHIEWNFSSLGITGPRALKLLKVAAEGAAVGHADLVDVTNALGAAEASGIKGVHNFSQAMGVLNAIVGPGDMHMQDLAEAFGTGVLAAVKQYGVSIKDAGAALAVFGDNNIRGAHAGTALRVAVQSLSVPTAAGTKLLAGLGIQSDQLAKDMQKGGLKLALEDLTKHFQKAGVTGDKMGQIVTAAFGKKAGVGLSILLGQMDRFESKYPALTKGAKGFEPAWQRTKKTVAQQVKQLQGSFDTFEIRLGQRVLPVLISIFNWAKKNTPVIIGVGGAIAGIAVTITTVNAAIKVFSFAKGVWTLAAAGVKAFRAACVLTRIELAALWVQQKIVAGATAVWTGVTAAVTFFREACIGTRIALVALAVQEKIITAAQWLWNVAMDAKPDGPVVIAIAAPLGALIYVYTHFQWVPDFVQAVWRDVEGRTVDAWHGIQSAAKAVWDWLKQNWPLLLGIITGPIGLAAALIFKYWDKITAAAKFLWGALKTGFDDVWGALQKGAAWRVDKVLGLIATVIDPPAGWFGFLPFGLGKGLKAAAAKVDQFRNHWNKTIAGLNDKTVKVGVNFTTGTGQAPGTHTAGGRGGGHAEGWRVPGFGGGDRWPALLEGGEAVVPKHLVPAIAPFLSANGVPGFAAGGIAGGVSAVTSFPSVAVIGAPTLPGVQPTSHPHARSIFASAGGGFGAGRGGAGVTRWAPVILAALGLLGQSGGWLGLVERRMNQESGGNPYAVNRWDSNWAAGTPSVGLMQVI